MLYYFCVFFFFFSSRRRHTRWTGDWSSDVCSSDLIIRQHYITPHLGSRMMPSIRSVEIHVGRFDTQLASTGHRVAGVDGEIHNHLLDLALVSFDPRYVGRKRGAHGNVLAQYAREHLDHVADQIVQVQDRRGQNLLPTKGQKLARERSRPLPCFFNFFNMLDQGVLPAELSLEKLSVADNDAQEIVEVVSNSSRQPADGLHFSGHLQLALEDPFLRYVFDEEVETNHVCVTLLHAAAAAADGYGTAIASSQFEFNVFELVFHVQTRFELHKLSGVGENPLTELGVQQFVEVLVSQHPLKGRVRSHERTLCVGSRDSIRGVFDHRAKRGFR